MDANVVWDVAVRRTHHQLTDRAVLFLGAVGLLFVAMLVVWSWIPAIPAPSQQLLIPLAGLTAVVWLPTLVWVVRGSSDSPSWREGPWQAILDRLPHKLRTIFVMAFVVLGIAFVSAIPAIFAGNPEMTNGEPTLNNHGAVVEVSPQVYDGSVRAHVRFATAVLGSFLLLAVATATSRNITESKTRGE